MGMFYCCTGNDGTIRGCTDQLERDDEGELGGAGCRRGWGVGLDLRKRDIRRSEGESVWSRL